MLKKSIYYPNSLNAALQGEYSSTYKTFFCNNDENEHFKGTLFTAINKTIELAYYFDTVYLDYIDYVFIVSDMINNHHNNPSVMNLLDKITYVDGDMVFLSYRKHGDNDWRIAVSGKPIQNSGDVLNEIKEKVKVTFDFSVVENSISKRLIANKIDYRKMTESCYLEIKNGYYQSFSLNENGHLYINDDNHQFYDLILSNFRNTYLCKEYGIDSIYRSEYECEIEKRRCEFIDSVGYLNIEFSSIRVINICLLVAENRFIPPFDYSDSSLPFKNLQIIAYNGKNTSHQSFSSNFIDDYGNKNLNLVYDDGTIKNINYYSFSDYLKRLNETGALGRTTKLLIKNIPTQFVRDFITKGKIRFSKPQEWVRNADISIGKGDFNEGMINPIITSKKEHQRLQKALNDNYGWCCFGLDNLLFTKTVVFNGKRTREAKVPKKFFDDFNGDKNNTTLFIDPSKFLNRLMSFIKETDYSIEQILCSPITYIIKRIAHLKAKYPFELFYKDINFAHQNEIRIIIPKDESVFYKTLCENDGIVEIGDLSDIVTILETPESDLTFILDGDRAFYY